MSLQIGIYLFPEVEVLDFAGPYEVFTTASRVQTRQGGEAPFKVCCIAEQAGRVRARAGLQVEADYTRDNHPPLDLLIIPGGVVDAEMNKAELIDWLRSTAEQARITAAVCTGAFLLAKAGLLAAQAATTHWEDQEDLARQFPAVQVIADQRWVDLGPVVTSGGISAGIDMSLHLVERLHSRQLAERTARQMEFRWAENPA